MPKLVLCNRARLSKAGLRWPRVSAKFQFRYGSLKIKFSLILLSTIWRLEALKKIAKIIQENAFKRKKKKPGIKFNPGLALISLIFKQLGSAGLTKRFLNLFPQNYQFEWPSVVRLACSTATSPRSSPLIRKR